MPRYRGMETFEVTGLDYSGPEELVYNPIMARLIDGVTNLKPTSIAKTVDNFLVKSLKDGKFELYLTHTIKEENDIVIEGEVVATWHFESIEHLEDLNNKIAESVKRQKGSISS
jgi:hypothetical protein